MDSFFKALLTESPLWVQVSIFIVCILGLIIIFIFFIMGAYRFATAVNKESKAFDLSKSNHDLVRENESLKAEIVKFTNVVEATSNVIEVSNRRLDTLYKSTFQKMLKSWRQGDVELLTRTKKYFLSNMSDIIYSSLSLAANEVNYQNKGRLSLWSIDTDEANKKFLKKVYKSVQFNYSKDETKRLNINESIAGRAYRTKIDQIVLDLESDPDWDNKLNSNYQAIIAFPIGESRVLTIDFKTMPNQKELDFIKQIALHIEYLYGYRDSIHRFMILMTMIINEVYEDDEDEDNEDE